MRNYIFVCAVLLYSFPCFAQEYSVLLLPDSLRKNADAVLRKEETVIIVHGINSASVKHTYAYTILNEAGSDYARYAQLYDNFTKLSDASGKLYDAFGKQIRSVKKREMEDVAYSDNFSLAVDGRIKKHNFYWKTYPYTIEYEEEQEYEGLYEFPRWQPLDQYNCAVQSSSYSITVPAGYNLRYKLANGAVQPQITKNGKTETYSWKSVNLRAVVHEVLQPAITTVSPLVLTGPDDFEYGGYKGNLSSWENYGKYYSLLYKDRDALPENIKNEVHRLTDALATREEKVKAIYNYLQQNTHYVSIQLGIGGLQPFPAQFVAEKKYGDCKALSNYMVSMLKEAGVKAYAAVIYGGETAPFIYDDFPRHYFNHVVACVPNGKDSLWLECTDQDKSAGYAGTFTGNRKALLITEEGGRLVNTPHYSMNDNLQLRKIVAAIDEEGNLTAASSTHFTGIQQELQHDLLHRAKPEEREKYLNSKLNLPTYKVEKIDYKETKGVIPAMDETLTITSQAYASITGKRLFITPNIFNKAARLPEDKDRHFDIVFKTAWKDADTAFISVPAGYTVESMPKNVSFNNKFGKYEISFSVNGNVIEMIRIREQPEAVYPAADYPQLVEYFEAISKADRSRVVMVKN